MAPNGIGTEAFPLDGVCSSSSSGGGGGGSGRRADTWEAWRALGLDFGPGDFEGVRTIEDAYNMLDPSNEHDARIITSVAVGMGWDREQQRQWRRHMQSPHARAHERALHGGHRRREQQERRAAATRRAQYAELVAACDHRHDVDEQAFLHFVDEHAGATGLDDRAYAALVDELSGEWGSMGDAARGVHYDAEGLPRPAAALLPLEFDDDAHRSAFTALRVRRRRPQRGHGPDHHLPRAYRLQRVGVGEGWGLAGAAWMRRAAEWLADAAPPASALVAHTLDRLEYVCARDLSQCEGAVADALLGEETAVELEMAALRASRVEFARAVSEGAVVLPTQEPEQVQWLQEQAAADAVEAREAHRHVGGSEYTKSVFLPCKPGRSPTIE